MNDEKEIIQKIELLEQIVESQGRTLQTDNQIIDIKNRLLELAEEENKLQRKEIVSLKIAASLSFGLFVLVLCILLDKL